MEVVEEWCGSGHSTEVVGGWQWSGGGMVVSGMGQESARRVSDVVSTYLMMDGSERQLLACSEHKEAEELGCGAR